MRKLGMTGEDFTAAMERLHTTPDDVAFSLAVSRKTVRRWEVVGPPLSTALFLRLAIHHHLSLDDAIERASGLEFTVGQPVVHAVKAAAATAAAIVIAFAVHSVGVPLPHTPPSLAA